MTSALMAYFTLGCIQRLANPRRVSGLQVPSVSTRHAMVE